MDFFNNVYKIILPEGEVKTVHDNNNNLLWQKAKIYRVSMDKSSRVIITRIGDASGFSSLVVAKRTGAGRQFSYLEKGSIIV